ncbi:MAG: polymer-forming cytoskeletal protein [Nitrospira sp.]|nr:polymer-forming cytoskeletal protein [Nitrospira sp.]
MRQPEKLDYKRSAQSISAIGDSIPLSPHTKPESTDAIVAFVGKGVAFNGAISYSGTVRIDGSLDGEIQTDGTLLVGPEAIITAKVSAGTIVCMGKITGDVTAKEKIKLLAPAVLNGGVKTPKFSIEDGVLFNGTVQMTQAARKATREMPLRSTDDREDSSLRQATA